MELFGDPNTLTQLIVLFGLWISEKRANNQQFQVNLINTRGNSRANIEILLSIGYTREEIEAVLEFLDDDIATIINVLKDARLSIASGYNIDQN